MESVGIRELRQNASQVVARAAAGEVITITDRGRPVAQMTATRPSKIGLRVKMCVWLGVSRGLDLAFLNAD